MPVNGSAAALYPGQFGGALGQRQLLGLLYPVSIGGLDRDLFYSITFLEELGRCGYCGFRAAVSVHAYMATYYLAPWVARH